MEIQNGIETMCLNREFVTTEDGEDHCVLEDYLFEARFFDKYYNESTKTYNIKLGDVQNLVTEIKSYNYKRVVFHTWDRDSHDDEASGGVTKEQEIDITEQINNICNDLMDYYKEKSDEVIEIEIG